MTLSQPHKLCLDCRHPMHVEARKCTACQSYQGPRRWFALGATVTSIAIALVTLAGLVGPQVQFMFSPPTAVHVSTIASTGDAYVLLVENRGRRPVVLNQAIAFWPDADDLAGDGLAFLEFGTEDASSITLIEGRTSVVVPLYFPFGQERPDHALSLFFYEDYPPMDGSDCMLDIEFAHADGVFLKRISELDGPEGEDPTQCNPEFWNFLQGAKPVG